MILFYKRSGITPSTHLTKLRHNIVTSTTPQTVLPWCRGDKFAPGAETHVGRSGTHSFGLGLVGSGGPSFPWDGDSLPGAEGESGAMWAETGASAAGSVCGRGGGGGGSGSGSGVFSGTFGGDGGFGGWPLCRVSGPASSTSELICTGCRADTLGQISSSLMWKPSEPGWGSVLGGSSRRLISVGGGGGGGKDIASSKPELSPDMPLLDESSAAEGNKQGKWNIFDATV